MRICVFEDRRVADLEPLTLTRPAFDLRCGTGSLLDSQERYFSATETGALLRPDLVDLSRYHHADVIINDLAWLRGGLTILANARWLPPLEPPAQLQEPQVALAGKQVAYAIVPADWLVYVSPNTIDDCLESWKRTLPKRIAGGAMLDYPWDLVEHNGDMIRRDCLRRTDRAGRDYPPANFAVVGQTDQLFVDASARIEPFVVADTTRGPVIIDREAVVQSFSRLEGPCYLGPKSWVLGAKIRGSSIGPMCRVGGEVEASILHGHSNKYHDGFLGHSYVGEWVNLAAGTQISDLRNDYGPVSLTINGRKVDSGLNKVGAFIGDHTKTGLSTLLNTGTVVGAFCNLLPSGSLLPKAVPSFCTMWNGSILEYQDLERVLTTAGAVMNRRGCDLTRVHTEFFRSLHQQTKAHLRQALGVRERQLVRQSA